jgi:hypothetical protein
MTDLTYERLEVEPEQEGLVYCDHCGEPCNVGQVVLFDDVRNLIFCTEICAKAREAMEVAQ